MQHQEKYTLHWHSYTEHLREALSELMLSSEFADVTLVTDDKQQIRAHRNILSAASPVFKNILQLDRKNVNPVIYLRGIKHSEMESIMQFIYLGEARFYEERMSEFIAVFKNLEIKDLSIGIDMNDESASNAESNDYEVHDDNEDNNFDECATSLNEGSANVVHHTQTTPIIAKQSFNKNVKRTEVISGDTKLKCQDCERVFSGRGALWSHIKSKHEGVKYACNQCDY